MLTPTNIRRVIDEVNVLAILVLIQFGIMSDKLQFVAKLREAKAYRTSNCIITIILRLAGGAIFIFFAPLGAQCL